MNFSLWIYFRSNIPDILLLYFLGNPRSYQQWVHTVKVMITLHRFVFLQSNIYGEMFSKMMLLILTLFIGNIWNVCIFFHILNIFILCYHLLIFINIIFKMESFCPEINGSFGKTRSYCQLILYPGAKELGGEVWFEGSFIISDKSCACC